jgi:hypothetical protein
LDQGNGFSQHFFATDQSAKVKIRFDAALS